jgi:hypothetical protein
MAATPCLLAAACSIVRVGDFICGGETEVRRPNNQTEIDHANRPNYSQTRTIASPYPKLSIGTSAH